jgi:hypothetical protein
LLFADLQKKIHNALAKYGEKGGTSMRMWFGHKPFLVVADGKIAEVCRFWFSKMKIDIFIRFFAITESFIRICQCGKG